jgi:diacylglycerol kinase (ATP)
MPGRALLLVNRAARRGAETLDEAVACLRELGLELVEESSAAPQRLAGVIARFRGEVDRVVIGGGDGTLSAALPGLLETGLPLGILPLGTANNVARTLGIPAELPGACRVAAEGVRRRIDVGQVNDRYFLTAASLGLSVRLTARLTGTAKRRWGVLAYAVTAVRAAVGSRPFHADIEWESGRLRTRTLQIVVGNGRYYGSAMTVAEDAAIDDARLDLYSIEAKHWLAVAPLLPALKRGRQGEKRQVETLHARELTIRTRRPRPIDVDGELVTRTPARFRVLPGALTVFAPPEG